MTEIYDSGYPIHPHLAAAILDLKGVCILNTKCAFVSTYHSENLSDIDVYLCLTFVIIAERYATAMIRHFGNFDTRPASFQIQNGV